MKMAHDTSAKFLPLLALRRGVMLPAGITTVPLLRKEARALAAALQREDQLLVAVQRGDGEPKASLETVHPIATVARVKDRVDRGRRGQVLVLEGLGRARIAVVEDDPAGFQRAAYDAVGIPRSVEAAQVAPAGGTTDGGPTNNRADAIDDDSLRPSADRTHSQTGMPEGGAAVPRQNNPVADDQQELRAYAAALVREVRELAPDDRALLADLQHSAEPGQIADRIALWLDLPPERRLEVLLATDVEQRLQCVVRLLAEAKERASLQQKVDAQVRQELNQSQKEAILRHQMRAIQKELGEDGDELESLREKLAAAKLPPEAQQAVDRELSRLGSLSSGQPEAGMLRSYLEWMAALPWSRRAETELSLRSVEEILEEDHYGLGDVKRRILEHMAVMKLANEPRGTLLCLVGPPGVGKTSLAQSVAHAIGRPLARVALGGVRDDAEIRGHRRTYVGSLPGRIVAALRRAEVKNPVLVLDEIDKLSRGVVGDPEAALLEVLDPEQNQRFVDHYIEVPFDLSEVLFIATANDVSALSLPLRDRLEVVEISGYTTAEKVRIGLDYLLPKQIAASGLPDSMTLNDAQIELIVNEYTREAGVRQLSRELAKVCRSLALAQVQQSEAQPTGPAPAATDGGKDAADASVESSSLAESSVQDSSPAADSSVADAAALSLEPTDTDLRRMLGRPRYFSEHAEHSGLPGIAAGLAWTPVGGDVLYVESTRMAGKGKLEITGQLGEVMQESARAALAYLRTRAEELGIATDFLEANDIHIHVPAGAVPKDGPSAGVTMFAALASLLTGRCTRSDTAMTGEATLRGRVLPVGGIKSKLLAAHRAGFARVLIPKRNDSDLEEVPPEVLNDLEVIPVETMDDVIREVLLDDPATTPKQRKAGRRRGALAANDGSGIEAQRRGISYSVGIPK